MVIQRCNDLLGKRDGTLAALCRVSKQLKPAAERALYSDLALGNDLGASSPVSALFRAPRLRHFVESVYLHDEDDTLDDFAAEVIHVLCSMSNIKRLVVDSEHHPAARLILAHPDCRLRSLALDYWNVKSARILAQFPSAFAALEHLEVGFDDDFAEAPPPVLSSLTSVTVRRGHDLEPFQPFTAPLVGQLAELSLEIWETECELVDLSAWIALERIGIDFRMPLIAEELELAVAGIIATLKSVPRSPGLVSFTFRAFTEDGILAPAHDILLALPHHSRHLALVTNAIRSADLATFLLSTLRPPSLRTLRLGGRLARDFRTLLDDTEGPHGALAGELERAGIEVTTTAVEP